MDHRLSGAASEFLCRRPPGTARGSGPRELRDAALPYPTRSTHYLRYLLRDSPMEDAPCRNATWWRRQRHLQEGRRGAILCLVCRRIWTHARVAVFESTPEPINPGHFRCGEARTPGRRRAAKIGCRDNPGLGSASDAPARTRAVDDCHIARLPPSSVHRSGRMSAHAGPRCCAGVWLAEQQEEHAGNMRTSSK